MLLSSSPLASPLPSSWPLFVHDLYITLRCQKLSVTDRREAECKRTGAPVPEAVRKCPKEPVLEM